MLVEALLRLEDSETLLSSRLSDGLSAQSHYGREVAVVVTGKVLGDVTSVSGRK